MLPKCSNTQTFLVLCPSPPTIDQQTENSLFTTVHSIQVNLPMRKNRTVPSLIRLVLHFLYEFSVTLISAEWFYCGCVKIYLVFAFQLSNQILWNLYGTIITGMIKTFFLGDICNLSEILNTGLCK